MKKKLLKVLFLVTVSVIIVFSVNNSIADDTAAAAHKFLPNEVETIHFHIYSDLDKETLEFNARVFEGFTEYFKKNYFDFTQEERLRVYLFDESYKYNKYRRENSDSNSRFGYYSKDENLIVANSSSGLGMLTHVFVYHFIDKKFIQNECPRWIAGGLAMFFEKFIGHFDSQRDLNISFGYYSNWRFPKTKRQLKRLSLNDITRYRDRSAARSFMLFLHKKEMLKDFIHEIMIRENDPLGKKTLEKVYKKKIPQIEKEWKDWARSQPIDDNVLLVKKSFVKSQGDWELWWNDNQERLYWDDMEQIYKVKDPKTHMFKAYSHSIIASIFIILLVSLLIYTLRKLTKGTRVIGYDDLIALSYKCPKCNMEMKRGFIIARHGILWRNEEDKPFGLFDSFNKFLVNTLNYSMTIKENRAFRCENCKYVLFDHSALVGEKKKRNFEG